MPDTMSSTEIAGQAGNDVTPQRLLVKQAMTNGYTGHDVIPDLIGDLSPK